MEHLPAVAKNSRWIGNLAITCSQVILGEAIEISAQTTKFSFVAAWNGDLCMTVPIPRNLHTISSHGNLLSTYL